MMRLFFAGRPLLPVRSAGSLSLILSHSQLLISYRFILLFYHFSVLCASFIFQTRPSKVTGFVELHKTFSLFLEIATKIGKMLDNPLLLWYDVISKVTGYLTRNGGKQE